MHEHLASLLPHVAANQRAQVLQGWRRFQREVGQIEVNHTPTTAALGQRVKPEGESQNQWRAAVRRYTDAVSLEMPEAEFCFLLRIAADMQTHYLQRLMAPQTSRDAVLDTCSFQRYNRILLAGFYVIDAAVVQPLTTVDVQETLREAVKAMRQELFEGLAWQCGAMQEHPLAEMREWGSIYFAGVMCSMINTDIPRLHNVLVQDGKPHHVLLERLPAYVCSTWPDKSGSGLEELRDLIVKQIIEDCGLATLSNHLSRQSLRKAHSEIAQWSNSASSLEEWSATQEVSQRLDELAACAGLSPRGAEVLALLRQGLTQEQIGEQLHLPRGTVKTYCERVAEKMYKAAQG